MGHFTGDRQKHNINNRVAKHRVAHFTGDSQITGSRISREMAKSQGRAFHGRWPNHRVAHFTGDGQITGSRISREMTKLQGRAFDRMLHDAASFHRMRSRASQDAREIGQTTGCEPFTRMRALHGKSAKPQDAA